MAPISFFKRKTTSAGRYPFGRNEISGTTSNFIKYLFPHVTVTPIIYGCEDYKKIAGIIKRGTTVIVSNLSRYVPERENIKLDEQTSRMIERKQIQDLDMELADGAIGICAAIEFAKQNDLEFVKTGHTNSSQTNHDTSNVVGYGGWYLV